MLSERVAVVQMKGHSGIWLRSEGQKATTDFLIARMHFFVLITGKRIL